MSQTTFEVLSIAMPSAFVFGMVVPVGRNSRLQTKRLLKLANISAKGCNLLVI